MDFEQSMSQDLFLLPQETEQESMSYGPADNHLTIVLYQGWTNYLNGYELPIKSAAHHHQPAEENSIHSEAQSYGANQAQSQNYQTTYSQESYGKIASSTSTSSSSQDKTDIFPKKTTKKRKPNFSNENETRNIVNNILRKAAREFSHDISSQSIVKRKLSQQGIAFFEFQDLLRNIITRFSTSTRDLLYLYVRPKITDPKYQLKLIFAEYFKFYIENYLPVGLVQEKQIKNRQLYINYARHCLAYLGQPPANEQFDCQTTSTFENIGQF